MNDAPPFDAERAHKYFAADCFNNAWGLIEKPDRSAEDDEQLIRLAQASLFHWTQRPDCTDKNLSIGFWLASRVYVLVGEAENACKYGRLCLGRTPADDSFCLGYAHEALARATALAGRVEESQQHLSEAWQHAEGVEDAEDKKLLIADLESLQAD